MRILFVAFYFQPEPNFFFGLPFAKELANRGHQVEVLTAFPNYPGGKIYPGYKIRPIQRENLDGIPVIRVPLYPSHDRSSLRRIASYTSWAFAAATIGPLAVKPADVAYISQGPATIGLPGIMLRLLRRIPYVYDIKDLWPDGPIATGMFSNPFGVWACRKWCRLTYKCASRIVVCTPGYKQKLVERGIPADKIEIIYNWCDESQIFTTGRDEKLAKMLGMKGKFNIVFAGNIGKSQAMAPVIDAAAIVADQYPDVQFLLIGDGIEVQSLKQKAHQLNLKNVVFLERRPVNEIGAILTLADVLLVHLKNEPVFRITIPSKTQAYMAIGRPLLSAVGGDTNDLVCRANAGLVCEPEDANGIAAAVCKFRNMTGKQIAAMGANGQLFYQRELSFATAVKKYEKLFESLSVQTSPENLKGCSCVG